MGALGGAKIGKIGLLERSGPIKLLLSLCTRVPASPSPTLLPLPSCPKPRYFPELSALNSALIA